MLDIFYNFITEVFTDAFSKDILYGAANSVTIIVGVCSLLSIISKLIYEYRLKRLATTNRPEWLSEEEFYSHTHNYIKTRVKDIKGNIYTFNNFIKKNIIKERKQYHLILGETGTGKSTFIINLYTRFNFKIFRRGYATYCISLRMTDAIDRINKIENPKKVILLLDAFDESHEANVDPVNFLNKIEENTRYFAKVVISSRNNFFDNDESVPVNINIKRILKLNYESYNRYYIHPFTWSDVNFYILKKYRLSLNKIIRSIRLINKCKEIMFRPVILSYIDLLIEDKANLSKSYYIYEQIITNWIKREAFFISDQVKEVDYLVIVEQLKELINKIAIYMYKNYPIYNDYYILVKDLNQIDNAYYLNHTDGKRNRSLFDRVDNKLFFSHKSILEYLLAINFDKIFFRFEKNLNTLYYFLDEIAENNNIYKFSALKSIYYKEYDTLKSFNFLDDDYIYKFEKNYMYSLNCENNKSEIYDVISWYCKSVFFPLFVNKKIYKRLRIELKFGNIRVDFSSTDNFESEKCIVFSEKIIHIINLLFTNEKNAKENKYINILIKIFFQEVNTQL